MGIRAKGLEDLNVYRHQQAYGEKVREDLNMQRRLRCLARDRPSRYGGRGMRFFVGRGPVPRDCSLILAILAILVILLQTIAIKVLTDLFSLLRLRSIDIKVFQTFSAYACCVFVSEAGWPGLSG